MQKGLPIIHNSFYTRNTRKEKLHCLDGLPWNKDMDMYDYEFDENGALTVVHKKVYSDNY